eukprot:9014908-Alexandrium_andersonii.AAC.1
MGCSCTASPRRRSRSLSVASAPRARAMARAELQAVVASCSLQQLSPLRAKLSAGLASPRAPGDRPFGGG